MSNDEGMTPDGEEFVIKWVKTPGPDWKTNPGEPIAVPKAVFTEPITLEDGRRIIFDPKQNAFVPFDE